MKTFKTFREQRQEAINKLVELGVMHYVKDLNTYHGRAGNGSGWQVNPNFNNAGNNTGNRNVSKISVLYTGEFDIAKRFASARRSTYNPQIETYKIVPQSQDYVIFDRTFNIGSLTPRQRAEFASAMETLTSIPVLKLSPIKFEHREAYPYIRQEIRRRFSQMPSGLFRDEDIEDVCISLTNNTSVMRVFKTESEMRECVTKIIAASNTKRLMRLVPNAQLRNTLRGNDSMEITIDGGDQFSVKISPECALNLCKEIGIVGAKEAVYSATLDEDIDIVEYFDLKSVVTEQQLSDKTNHANEVFGKLSGNVESIIKDKEVVEFFQNASAKELMQYIYQNPKIADMLSKSSGVWEGYTVGQHIEAVLTFLDEYKINEIPKQVLPLMKIAILAHDLGKGYAVDPNSPWYGKHKEANKAFAHELYSELGVDPQYTEIIDFIFTEGQDFTSQYYFGKPNNESIVQGKDEINRNMQRSCYNIVNRLLNGSASISDARGLQKLCITLQQCDSGAYTRYATINAGDGLYYCGGSDRFTKSFTIGSDGNPRLKTYKDEHIATHKV